MNKDYLDKSYPLEKFLKSLNLENSEDLSELKSQIKYLTYIQSNLMTILQKNRKRILIESSLKNGKSFSFFFFLLNKLQNFLSSEKKESPIIVWIYANKRQLDDILKTLKVFKTIFSALPLDLIFLDKPEENIKCENDQKTIRVISGTILDNINCFRKNDLNPMDIDTLFIDDLDYIISFGQLNNISRFVGFLNIKNPFFFKNCQTIVTVKEDLTQEMEEFRKLVKEKFVNIRIKIDYDEEIKKLDNVEVDQNTKNMAELSKAIYNQFYYINENDNLFSLLFLIIKFEIFPDNFLIIVKNIEEVYRLKLFLERINLTEKAVVYNPTHPSTLKSYRISLFNKGQSNFFIAPKNILEDLKKNKEQKDLKKIKNILFFNPDLDYNEYIKFLDFLSKRQKFGTKNFNDYNICTFVNNKHKNINDENNSVEIFQNLLQTQRENYGRILFQPIPIERKDIILYNYRVQEVINSLSKRQIKLFRLIEVKKIMLKSKKMKNYFKTKQNEKNLLLHKLNELSKDYNKHKVNVSSNIPPYLEPSFLKEENEKLSKLNFMRKKASKTKRKDKFIHRENPVITPAQHLKTYSSHKLWKIKHKIKKRTDKRSIRKGNYKII